MSLYYVYMKWYRPSMELTNWAGRQLLTCESRYAADEFFRELQTVSGAQGRRFTLLERVTPQFWRYDTEAGPETAIIDTLRFNAISDASKGAIMVTHLWNTADRNWVIAPSVPGPDWVFNRSYFIRNIRQPELYWFYPGSGRILASRTQKTKFHIASQATLPSKSPIIRSDSMIISIASNSDGSRSTSNYVNTSDNKLRVTSDITDFRFDSLLQMFGTTWENNAAGALHEYITWSSGGGLDGWELC